MAATLAVPCPQARGAVGVPAGPPNAWDFAVEADPPNPRPGDGIPILPMPIAPNPQNIWPYHLPRWNAVDAFWWSLLARSCYWANDQFVTIAANWAGPIIRKVYVPPSAPPTIGHAFIELPDQVLVIVPGTSSEGEFLRYFCTHALESTRSDVDNFFTCNTTWFQRGQSIATSLTAWDPPPLKPIVYIGHSSGGATAAIAQYFRLRVADTSFKTIVTFGSPQWAMMPMRSILAETKSPQVIEFATPADPVVHLPPPFSVLDALGLLRLLVPRPEYVRYGVLLDLVGVNGTALHPVSTYAAALASFQGLLRQDANLGGHAMRNYTTAASAWAFNFCSRPANLGLISGLLGLETQLNNTNI